MHSKSLKAKYKNTKIKRGYYNASILFLQNFNFGKRTCPNCLEDKSCFIIPPHGEFENLCTDCLRVVNIEFSHDTEKGIVSKNGLLPNTPDEYNIYKHVKLEYIKKLLDTPEFRTIQGGQWKLHCDDFMEFQGVWEPSDFTEHSKTNGKDLFMKMTEESSNFLWDEVELKDNETEDTWANVEYYAFKCLHCKKYKGFWEY
jgi:uncharacterized protein CbrC (UPF0167 family)